jgi:hypothetical protein
MESGLSQITLERMICEARSFGLVIDAQKVQTILGRISPPPPVPVRPESCERYVNRILRKMVVA